MIDRDHPGLSIARQCELASISRASFYRAPAGESEATLALMRLIDETFLECPFYGARQMMRHLNRMRIHVGRRRQTYAGVQRATDFFTIMAAALLRRARCLQASQEA